MSANGAWYPSSGRVVARWGTHETKSVTWMSAGQWYTTQKIRKVDMKTVVYVGVFDSCPDRSPIELNPTRNDDDNTDVVYDSRVQWDPVTHKATKTDTVRTSVNEAEGHDGGWYDMTETGSN